MPASPESITTVYPHQSRRGYGLRARRAPFESLRSAAPRNDRIQVLDSTTHMIGFMESLYWYRFCAGPTWLYPHRRVCRHGYC